jgi:hypothetical protein
MPGFLYSLTYYNEESDKTLHWTSENGDLLDYREDYDDTFGLSRL